MNTNANTPHTSAMLVSDNAPSHTTKLRVVVFAWLLALMSLIGMQPAMAATPFSIGWTSNTLYSVNGSLSYSDVIGGAGGITVSANLAGYPTTSYFDGTNVIIPETGYYQTTVSFSYDAYWNHAVYFVQNGVANYLLMSTSAATGTVTIPYTFYATAGDSIQILSQSCLGCVPTAYAWDYTPTMAMELLPATAGNSTLSCTPLTNPVGGTSTCTVTGLNLYGQPAPGTFALTSAPGSTLSTNTCTTTASVNTCSFTVTSPTDGTYAVSAQIDATNIVNSPTNVTFRDFNYWDGNAGPANNSVVNGGVGTWAAVTGNWTNINGIQNGAWTPGKVAYFQGTAGTVTLGAAYVPSVAGMQFGTTGYTVAGPAGTRIAGTLAATPLTVTTGTDTISAILSGAAIGYEKLGAGTLALGGINTYTGPTKITAGVLSINNVTAAQARLGASAVATASNLVFNGGTLQYTGATATFNRAFTITAGTTGSIDVSTAAAVMTASAASAATTGNLTKLGAGTLSLTGVQAYTGLTTVSAGTLAVTGTGDLNSTSGVLNNSVFQINRAAYTFSKPISGTGSLGIGAAGVVILTGTNTYTGPTSITAAGGSLQIGGAGSLGGGNYAGAITTALAGESLRFSSSVNQTLSGIISGPGNLTKDSITTSVLTLSGVNTYTGITAINVGTLSASTIGNGGVASNLGAATNVATNLVLGGGVLQYTGTTASTDRNYTLTAATNSSIEVTNAATNLTLTGASAASAGNLVKIGAGTLTLAGANLSTGQTTVSAGRLNVTGSTGSGGISVLSGATLGGTGTVGGATTINAGGTLSPGLSPGTLTITGNLTLAGILDHELAEITTVGGNCNDYTQVNGNLTLGGTLNLITPPVGAPLCAATFGAGTYRLMGYTGTLTGTFASVTGCPVGYSCTVNTATANQVNLVVTAANSTHWDGANTVAGGSVTGGDGGTSTWDAATTNWTTATGTPNGIWSNGANVAFFEGTAGTVTLGAGYTPSIGGLTFNTSGYTLTGGTGISGAATSNPITVNGIATDTATIATPLMGTNAFEKLGLGNLSLSGSVGIIPNATFVYTGNTTVSAGTLTLAAPATLLSPVTTVVSGATLALNVAAGSGVNLDGNISLSGTGVAGVGALVSVSGANNSLSTSTFTLPANATIASHGTMFQHNGTLSLGANTVTFIGSANFLVSSVGAITGTGNVIVSGGSSAVGLTVNCTATYTGSTTVTSGLLSIGDGGGNGSLDSTSGILNNGTVAFNRNNAYTFAPVISGSGRVTRDFNGTTTLTGANTYTGATLVYDGAMVINGSTAAGSAVTVQTAPVTTRSTTLAGSGTAAGTVTVRSAATISPGSTLPVGTATSIGTFNTGALTLQAGAITAIELGAAGVVGGALNDLLSVTGNLTLNGTLALSQSTGGTFTAGTYRLINYTGTRTGTFATVTGCPVTFVCVVDTATAGQVNLVVSLITYNWWDGDAGPANNSVINGGVGTWDNATTNWTTSTGATNGVWSVGEVAHFAGTAGTVTVSGAQSVSGLDFQTSGYTLTGGTSITGTLASNPIIVAGLATDTATIATPMAGGAGIGYDKQGLGILSLTGAYSFVGPFAVTAGTLDLAGNGVTTNDANAFTVASGATLKLSNATGVTVRKPIILSGTGVGGLGALLSTSSMNNAVNGSAGINGSITLAADATIGVGLAAQLRVSGPINLNSYTATFAGAGAFVALTPNGVISGTGGVNVIGTSTSNSLLVGSASTYSGATTIAAGSSMEVGNSTVGTIDNTSGVTIGAGGTFRISRTTGYTYNSFAPSISGAGNFVSTSNGVVILSGNNKTYTGTTYAAGQSTLLFNGTKSGTGNVGCSVGGGRLGGSGSVAGSLNVANPVGGTCTLSPGGTTTGGAPGSDNFVNSVGTLNVGSAGATLNMSTGTLDMELGAAGVVGGALNDLLVVTGNMALNGTLALSQSAGGTFAAGTYRLANVSGTASGSFTSITGCPVGFICVVDTNTVNQVNLIVSQPQTWWDGTNTTANSVVDGGASTWDNVATNWTDSTGTNNGPWDIGQIAHFAGTAGTVTISGTQDISGLDIFTYTGYTLTGGSLNGVAATNTIYSNLGYVSVTLDTALVGTGGFSFLSNGRFYITQDATYTGATHMQADDYDATVLFLGNGGAGGMLQGTSSITGATSDFWDSNWPTLVFNFSTAKTVNYPLHGVFRWEVLRATQLTLNATSDFYGHILTSNTAQIQANANDALGNGALLNMTDSSKVTIAASTTQHIAGCVKVNDTTTLVLNPASQIIQTTPVARVAFLCNAAGGAIGLTVAGGGKVVGAGTLDFSGTTGVQNFNWAAGAQLIPGNGEVANSVGVMNLNAGTGRAVTMGGTLVMDLGAPNVVGGALNDLVNVTGDLVLSGSSLNLAQSTGGSFTAGTYRLINYTGTLTGTFGSVMGCPIGFACVVDTNTANQVNLVVTAMKGLDWWDGDAGPFNNGVVNGGNGTWENATTRWTDSTGVANDLWATGQIANFAGVAGTVTVSGTQDIIGLNFSTSGYTLTGGSLNGVAATNTITTPLASVNVTLNTALVGTGGFSYMRNGVYTITQDATYSGATQIQSNDVGSTVLALGNGGASGMLTGTSGITGTHYGSVNNNWPVLRFNFATPEVTNFPMHGLLWTQVQAATQLTLNATSDFYGDFETSSAAQVLANVNDALGNGAYLDMYGTSKITLATGTTQHIGGCVWVNDNASIILNTGSQIIQNATSHPYVAAWCGSDFTVAAGAKLVGSGTIDYSATTGALNFNIGGQLTPGNGEVANSVGDITLNAGAGRTVIISGTLGMNLGAANVVGGALNDLVNVTGNLTLTGSTLNLAQSTGGSFTAGTYRLINYTGALTGTFATVTGCPVGFACVVDTATANQVNLVMTALTWWDGDAGPFNNSVVNGGIGTWDNINTRWTNSTGVVNGLWPAGQTANFAGTPGTVTIAGTQDISGLYFATKDYLLTGGTLNGVASNNLIEIVTGAGGATSRVTLDTVLASSTGGGYTFRTNYSSATQSVVLTQNATYTGPTIISCVNSGLFSSLRLGVLNGTTGDIALTSSLTGDPTCYNGNGSILNVERSGTMDMNYPITGRLSIYWTGNNLTANINNTGNTFSGYIYAGGSSGIVLNLNQTNALGIGSALEYDSGAQIVLAPNVVQTFNALSASTNSVLTLNAGSVLRYGNAVPPNPYGYRPAFFSGGSTLRGVGTLDWAPAATGGLDFDATSIVSPGLNGAGTLSMTVATGQQVNFAGIMAMELGAANVVGGALNDLVDIAGDLTLTGSTLNLSQSTGGNFVEGTYRLINYTGTLTGTIATVTGCPVGFICVVDTNTLNQVDLIVVAANSLTWWDGDAGPFNNNVVNGGIGTWENANTRWTDSTGAVNGLWPAGQIANFAGTAGTVTITGTQDISGLNFVTATGYVLTGGSLNGVAATNTITTQINGWADVTLDTALVGTGGFSFLNNGWFKLTQDATFTGATNIQADFAAMTLLQLGQGGAGGMLLGTSSLTGTTTDPTSWPGLEFNFSTAKDANFPMHGALDIGVLGATQLTLNTASDFYGQIYTGGTSQLLANANDALGNGAFLNMVGSSKVTIAAATTQHIAGCVKVGDTATLVLNAGSQIIQSTPVARVAFLCNVNGGALGLTVEAGAKVVGAGTLDFSGTTGAQNFNWVAGAQLVPGNGEIANSVGVINLNAGAGRTVNMDGTLVMDLGAPDNGAGNSSDVLRITGNLNLGASSALNFTTIAGYNSAAEYVLVTYTGTRTGTFVTDNLAAIGYQGIIVYDDANKRILLRALPSVTITKISNGGIGTFDFSMYGLSAGNVSLTTTVAGTPVSSAVYLGAIGAAAGITETNPSGWPANPASVSCKDANGASNSNGVGNLGTTAGNQHTLSAANMVAGANITCTFTNAQNSLSGKVFNDGGAPTAGVNSGTPNDGLQNGSEAGLSGVTVSLTNCGATTYSSATTDGSGAYMLSIPAAQMGSTVCVTTTVPTAYIATGANASGTVTSNATPTTVGGIAYTYTRTSQQTSFIAPANGALILNFGQVPVSVLMSNNTGTVAQGSNVTYQHSFTAGTGGSLTLGATATASPLLSGWTEVLYPDPGCTGTVQTGQSPIATPITVTQGQQYCFVLRQFAPTVVSNGSSNTVLLNAALVFTNAVPSLIASYQVTDLTSISSGAVEIKKAVRNVTLGEAFNAGNQAKSGDTLEYRITYTNLSAAPINTLVIGDVVPTFTTFISASAGALPNALTSCTKKTPANPTTPVLCNTVEAAGGTGPVSWQFGGVLNPGASGEVTFMLLVD